ncbi:MAG: glycerate kinase [Candidatus Dormibacteria bacterium]|jgi:glycerate kinase
MTGAGPSAGEREGDSHQGAAGPWLRILCAPNAFRGTLTAAAAAAALARGVRDAGAAPRALPMADGGDGTLDVLLSVSPSSRIERHRVCGPLGGRLVARLGWLSATTAVVEMAEAAGLRRIRGRPDPLRATSRGAGELIARALDGGARRILVGIGGSACTDGGAGLLAALGARLLDGRGHPLGIGGGALIALASADLRDLDPRLQGCRLEVACDVGSPLLGRLGAAHLFGPQKGATDADVDRLAAGLRRLAEVLERDAHIPAALRAVAGAGAAGGSGYGLAVAGAALLPGASLVADAIGLDPAIGGADLVITGEGRLDRQTAAGKAPGEVARRSARLGVACIAVAGEVRSDPGGFRRTLALAELAGPGEDPLRVPRRLLRRAGARIVREAAAPPRYVTRSVAATPRMWGLPR